MVATQADVVDGQQALGVQTGSWVPSVCRLSVVRPGRFRACTDVSAPSQARLKRFVAISSRLPFGPMKPRTTSLTCDARTRRSVADRQPIDDAEQALHRPSSWSTSTRLAAPFDQDADPVHVTGSAIVVGPRGVVLLKHKRLGLWLQPGGHIDAGETPWDAALREAREETGLDVRFAGDAPRAGACRRARRRARAHPSRPALSGRRRRRRPGPARRREPGDRAGSTGTQPSNAPATTASSRRCVRCARRPGTEHALWPQTITQRTMRISIASTSSCSTSCDRSSLAPRCCSRSCSRWRSPNASRTSRRSSAACTSRRSCWRQ